ncbi:SWI/SNF-related matrix-associated actin-dependent regulator of chromatin subfamily A-like protein 1 [Ctenocephalides felis]|uniref:SWI/SNF-related matrix-associated actin-dependent regulator of chromatin subfamily A-like protein 1 n=1 Tax=Ctenocephalides felis TaxID=7515 RepID=UPI000E6E407A|nr:SWI/SNF-related matrix-associated actin-dependent regulator of chromatin subfamily A-like protein 1 [Ctenocephalides felis]
MISETRFQVKTSNFHAKLIDAFKSIQSKQYDRKTKCWTFLFADYKSLLTKMNLLQPDISVERLPLNIISLLEQKPDKTIPVDPTKIEKDLWEKLYPFQKEGVRFGVQKNGRCMIADEMGLGKTIQALALASYYRDDWPLLIATTASVRNTWYQKCSEFLPSVSIHNVVCMSSGTDYIYDAKILIVTHSLLEKCIDSLKNRYGVIIYDESHTLKNFKAKCTNAALVLAKSAKRVILLTGTPALSRPSELFTQLYMLDDKFFVNFKEYSKRYCDGKESRFGWSSLGYSNLPELNMILNKKFMIRRTKEQVLPELNEINREVIKLNSKYIITNETAKEDLNSLAKQFSKRKRDNEHAALLTYFTDTAKYKLKAVCAYIKELIGEKKDEKILLFAHHKIMIESLCDLLNDCKIHYIKIDGSIKPEIRTKLVENFQTKQSCRAAVLSITSANAGITLTAAQLVIFAELHWTPSILAQAEARAHRIGKVGEIRVQYLVAQGTADDIIWPMLQKKQGVLNKIGLCNYDYGDANTKEVLIKRKNSEMETSAPKKAKIVEENVEQVEHETIASHELLMADDEYEMFMNVNLDF